MTNFDSFIFTHIPKCGGSSLRRFFHESSILSSISSKLIHIPGEANLASDKNINNLSSIDLDKLKKSNLKIIADHSKYNVHKDFKHLKNPFYFTILREPVERFISHYNFFYFKLGYSDCKGISLNSLPANKRKRLIQNLSNVQFNYILNTNIRTPNPYEVRRAINSLTKNYNSFGLLEYMNQTISLLNLKKPKWLSLPKEIPTKNTNKLNSLSNLPNENIVNEIRDANKADIYLYNFAKELFLLELKLFNFQIR